MTFNSSRRSHRSTHNNEFNESFDHALKKSDDVIEMVANLKFINSILMGMTEVLDNHVKSAH